MQTKLALSTFALLGSLLTPAAASAAAQPAAADLQTPGTPVVLVELFTSEGCSSCPPADELLQKINGKHTAAGQLIVGISEHVTYWNRLGWADPFSADTYTDRQNAYGNRFNLDSVYTPQMVINGREQIVGSSGGDLNAALYSESRHPSLNVHIASAERSQNALTVHFTVGMNPGESKPVDIMAVVADDVDRSHVLRGENADRTLEHVAVARSLIRVATVQSAGEQTVQVPLPPSVTSNAKTGHHLILFAQAAEYGPVLGTDARAF